MRRPFLRHSNKPLVKPTHFPVENTLKRTLPPHLVGEQEFEEYHFLDFDFTHTNLCGFRFSDCLFERCNFAGASLRDVALQNVAFEGCKLLGLAFHTCRDMLFGVHFNNCQLDYASFLGRALPNTRFVSCSLQEADFTQANLAGAVFQDCSLVRAVFHETNLSGADFTTSLDVALDPEVNELRQAKFALQSLPGLLTKYGLVIEGPSE